MFSNRQKHIICQKVSELYSEAIIFMTVSFSSNDTYICFIVCILSTDRQLEWSSGFYNMSVFHFPLVYTWKQYVGTSEERNVYFEELAYPQCKTTLHSPEWLNKWDNHQANVAEYVEQMEFSLITDYTVNWYNHFGKHWVIYTKTEHKHTPLPNNSTTRYISYRNVYMCIKSYTQEYSIGALFIVVQN